jgi:hypothetical protein
MPTMADAFQAAYEKSGAKLRPPALVAQESRRAALGRHRKRQAQGGAA